MSEGMTIDDKLYAELRKLVGAQPLCLFNSRGDFVEVYRRSEFKFVVPVGFFAGAGVDMRGRSFPPGDANAMVDAAGLSLPSLYPIQKQVLAELRASIRARTREHRPLYTTLHLACGFGKTVMTSYLIGMHRRRAVVCVPNKMLLSQWRDALAKLNVSCYVSSEGVARLLRVLRDASYNVLVVVNKHFANERFCRLVRDKYDVFVLDESHTYNLMNLTAMTRFLSFYPPRICYFLTATPRAANRVYSNCVINITKFSTLTKEVRVCAPFFQPYSTPRVREFVAKLDSPGNKYHIFTEKALAEDAPRNAAIVATLADAFRQRASNRIIVITKLRAHMVALFEALSAALGRDYVFLGDAQSRHVAEIVAELRKMERFVFVSTLFYAGTGLDIPSLDALAPCHAVMNSMQAEQLIGRICRETEHPHRVLYVFPTTGVTAIKNIVGLFVQRLVNLATQKLGFAHVPPLKACGGESARHALPAEVRQSPPPRAPLGRRAASCRRRHR
uniref:DNA helicase n=1 Tax=Rousettus bat poxvirus TaxID=3141933 RepID=A0AAU7E0X4_9POXV